MIRVGIIGLGFGRYGLLPAFRRDPRCHVEALCGRDAEKTSHWARELAVARSFTSYEALLGDPDIDAVAIAVPPDEQAAVARLAIARRKHVFAEKPLASALEDARSLAQDAAAAGIANVVDFLFQELPAWRRTEELLRANAIGHLRQVLVEWTMESYDYRHDLTTWKTRPASGGGVLRHFGSHAFYYLEHLLGPIAEMTATLSRSPGEPRPGDTLAVLGLSFSSGVGASVVLSSGAPFGGTHRLIFHGDRGTLRLENITKDPVRGFEVMLATRERPTFEPVAAEPDPAPVANEDSRVPVVARLASRFLSWVADGTETRPSFAEGARVQMLLAAAASSAASGRVESCAPPTSTSRHV